MNWQKTLQNTAISSRELFTSLQQEASSLTVSKKAQQEFPMLVPQTFYERIHSSDKNDPLLKQILPSQEEELEIDGYSKDPVGDLKSEKIPGILHKYRGRVLLILTGACAIHCRYCFRRHYPYSDKSISASKWQATLEYIQSDSTIEEVILSGGDPLTLTDSKLAAFCTDLASIPQLKRLRIHSRIPVVLPERIIEGDLSWLNNNLIKPIMVLHVNHAKEIDKNASKALQILKQLGIPLLNQAVLLKGVNDQLEDQIALSQCLFDQGVLPYYLHQLDPVQGASHFKVDNTKAQLLVNQMRENLSGYLVPKLVQEISGKPAKQPL